MLDGHPGQTYDRVAGLTFSPDSSHLAYIAEKAGKERVIEDGVPGPEYESIDPYFLRFTPAGSLGYRAQVGEKMTLVIDGEPAVVAPGILDWSASSQAHGVAAIIRSGSIWSVVFNGVKGPDFSTISAPVAVSPDGRHTSYTAQQGRRWFSVKDGVPGEPWDLMPRSPVFSADGSHSGFAARRAGGWYVVIDGHPTGPFDWFAWGSPRFSPDGRHWSFAAQKNTRWFVVEDGNPVVTCDAVAEAPPRFSADGKHFACMVRIGPHWLMVVDGEPGPTFDRLFDITPEFAPDGSIEYPAVRDNTLYRVTHRPNPRRP